MECVTQYCLTLSGLQLVLFVPFLMISLLPCPPLPSPPHPQNGLYDHLGKAGTLPLQTNETAPVAPVGGAEEPLPSGWKEYRTAEGQMYYHNVGTQMSSWMKPKGSTRRRKVGGSVVMKQSRQGRVSDTRIYISVLPSLSSKGTVPFAALVCPLEFLDIPSEVHAPNHNQ